MNVFDVNVESTAEQVLLGLGGAIAIIFWVVLIVRGFRCSAGWGITVLFLGQLGALIFAIAKWPVAGRPFLGNVAGSILFSVGLSIGMKKAALVARVEGEITQIKMVVKAYEQNNYFKPPTEAQGLRALVEKPTVSPVPSKWRQYRESIPVDPWGREYQYRVPGRRSKDKFDIFSLNQDGIENADDIGNWNSKRAK